MIKKTTISLLLAAGSFVGFAKTWEVKNSGLIFTPSALTVAANDTIKFVLGGNHDAKEVSKTTFDAGESTALTNGFSTPFGGGTVLAKDLTVGTHYYVCTPHASLGMKATITVEAVTGVEQNNLDAVISVFPNPSSGQVQVDASALNLADDNTLAVYSSQGEKISETIITTSQSIIDLSNQPKGIYFIRISNKNGVVSKQVTIQ